MMRLRMPLLGASLAALVGVLTSCGQRADAPHETPVRATSLDGQRPRLDAAAWVERVRAAHLRADGHVRAGDVERALVELQAAVETAAPDTVHPEHARVARQDLWFRIAQLELGRGRASVAIASTDTGLALGRARDLFTANLLIARGEALEAEGRRTEAAASYFEALQINARLLRTALGSADAGEP